MGHQLAPAWWKKTLHQGLADLVGMHATQVAAGEGIDLSTARFGEQARPLMKPARQHVQVVVRGEYCALAAPQLAARAGVIDGKAIDDGIHRKGQARLQAPLLTAHRLEHHGLGFELHLGIKDEPHAATRHAAQHPETPETLAKHSLGPLDESIGVVVRHPGNDALERTAEVPRCQSAELPQIAFVKNLEDVAEDLQELLARLPLTGGAKQKLLGHHLENRTDVGGHSAVYHDQGVLEQIAHAGFHDVGTVQEVLREQASATGTVFHL